MSFVQSLKEYLESNKRERNGLVSLLILCSLIIGFMALIPTFIKPELADKEILQAKIEAYLALQSEKKSEEKKISFVSDEKPNKTFSKKQKEFFEFNPNQTSDADWKKLGLNSGQIKSINNYLSKGGKFYKTEDLAKMYTISQNQYQELEPYISIPQKKKDNNSWQSWDEEKSTPSESGKEEFKEEYKKREAVYLDLNSVDTSELVKLKGIGPFYAKKIVELRSELGGFHSKEQLLEIWKFKPETLLGIDAEIHLGSGIENFIVINNCTVEDLVKHPYFSWKEAKALVAYRDQHGPFKDINEITKSHLISEEFLNRVKPYLKLN